MPLICGHIIAGAWLLSPTHHTGTCIAAPGDAPLHNSAYRLTSRQTLRASSNPHRAKQSSHTVGSQSPHETAWRMVLELHVWGPAFSLPSIDARCLAAIAYFTQAVPKGQWVLVASSDPALSPTSRYASNHAPFFAHQIRKHNMRALSLIKLVRGATGPP